MASNSTRLRAISLYKELHRLGRDYPDPSSVLIPLASSFPGPGLLSQDTYRTDDQTDMIFMGAYEGYMKVSAL